MNEVLSLKPFILQGSLLFVRCNVFLSRYVLNMTLNCIGWWGWESRVTPSLPSSLPWIVGIPSMDQIDLFVIMKCLPLWNDCEDTFLYRIWLETISVKLTSTWYNPTRVEHFLYSIWLETIIVKLTSTWYNPTRVEHFLYRIWLETIIVKLTSTWYNPTNVDMPWNKPSNYFSLLEYDFISTRHKWLIYLSIYLSSFLFLPYPHLSPSTV